MLSPVFLRAISTHGCCRLRAVFLYWHPHISWVSPGACRGRRNSSIQGKAGPCRSCAAERVLHSPSFTFYSDSSRSAGKDAEKKREKWDKTLWLKHLKWAEINFLPQPVFSVRSLQVTGRGIEFPKPTKHFVIGARGPVSALRPGLDWPSVTAHSPHPESEYWPAVRGPWVGAQTPVSSPALTLLTCSLRLFSSQSSPSLPGGDTTRVQNSPDTAERHLLTTGLTWVRIWVLGAVRDVKMLVTNICNCVVK